MLIELLGFLHHPLDEQIGGFLVLRTRRDEVGPTFNLAHRLAIFLRRNNVESHLSRNGAGLVVFGNGISRVIPHDHLIHFALLHQRHDLIPSVVEGIRRRIGQQTLVVFK